MNVTIVGPGRLGTLLAVAGSRAGWRVHAITGGSAAARRQVCSLVAGVRDEPDPAVAVAEADLLVLAVPDDAIEPVIRQLAAADALRSGQRIVHLSGARGPDALALAAMAGLRTAACHPAMTVPDGACDPELLIGVPWAVTAAVPDRDWAASLVEDLGGDPVVVPAEARVAYHAALSLASNAAAAAVVTARRALLAAGVERPERFLEPLAAHSVSNAARRGGVALTGPVVRGDLGTIEAHLAHLHRDLPEIEPAYRHLALAVLEAARPGMEPGLVAELRRLLDEEG